MDQSDLFSYYKWVTNIGIALFVAFSYFYFDSVTTLQSELSDLNERIETDNATIDNTTNNNTKIQLIKSNLAKAENASTKGLALTINRIVAILFMIIGLGAAGFGFSNLRKLMKAAEDEEV